MALVIVHFACTQAKACSPSTHEALPQCHKVPGSVQQITMLLQQGYSVQPCTSREAASALDKVLDGVQQAMPAPSECCCFPNGIAFEAALCSKSVLLPSHRRVCRCRRLPAAAR